LGDEARQQLGVAALLTSFKTLLGVSCLLAFCEICLAGPDQYPNVSPIVEAEEEVYSYVSANNGASPLWNFGSTNIVRVGERIFVSGLETNVARQPLNNTRCTLWQRDASGWMLPQYDPSGWTREPCPLGVFPRIEKIFVSVNPTLNPPWQAGGGPAEPLVLEISVREPLAAFERLSPVWRVGSNVPAFTEHSYRSFAADSNRGELVLLQNIGYVHAEWAFRAKDGTWNARGQLRWPLAVVDGTHRPLRVCYANVSIRNRAVHFAGVSNIVEPIEEWRRFKHKLTRRDWDFVFRRLFYSWTEDITSAPFNRWIELANRERTAGSITPGDLWIAPDGAAHIVWHETALDLRLRDAFFPHEKQRHELNYAVIRNGAITSRRTLVAADERASDLIPRLPRFHVTPENRLFVVFYVEGIDQQGARVAENRLLEVRMDGSIGDVMKIPLARALSHYMTANVRAGSYPSNILDLLGTSTDSPNSIRYARVRLQ
jgi:hypothetical protein